MWLCMSQVHNDDEASSSSLSFMSFLHRCPWVSSFMKFIVMALFISSVVVHMALQESSSQLMKFIVVHDVHRCPWRSSFRWVCFTMTELMKFVVHELTSSLSMSSRRSLCIWLCISRVYNDRAHEVHRLLVVHELAFASSLSMSSRRCIWLSMSRVNDELHDRAHEVSFPRRSWACLVVVHERRWSSSLSMRLRHRWSLLMSPRRSLCISRVHNFMVPW